MSTWYEHYLNGKIVQRNDGDARTPHRIIATMEDWLDGEETPCMRSFCKGESVDPKKLINEIKKTVNSNMLPDQIERLNELLSWATKEARLARAAERLRNARKEFTLAVEATGLSPYYASRISDIEC